MKAIHIKYLVFLFIIVLAACKNPDNKESFKKVTIVKTWQMPDVLKEISGIAWVDEQRMACVQDELGVIFMYNLVSKKIEKKISFASPGDFEAIAKVGELYYIMRADGQVFEVNTAFKNPEINAYTIDLKGLEDIESLTYDEANHQWLVMGKDPDPQIASTVKGVYTFNLVTKVRSDRPRYTIDMESTFLNKDFDKNGKVSKKKLPKIFQPSDIAIHPKTGEIFSTDGRHSSLVILDSMGILKDWIDLDKSHFPQPEGIAFSPSGELYISSEGAKQNGVISMVKINDSRN